MTTRLAAPRGRRHGALSRLRTPTNEETMNTIEPCNCVPCRVRRRSSERATLADPVDRIVFDNDINQPVWLRIGAMLGMDDPCSKESQ